MLSQNQISKTKVASIAGCSVNVMYGCMPQLIFHGTVFKQRCLPVLVPILFHLAQVHAAGYAVAVAHAAAGGRAGPGVPAGAARRRVSRRRSLLVSARAHQTPRAPAARARQPERGLPLRQPLCSCQW